MPGEVTLSLGLLYSFLLVLARVGGALIFVPLPGVKGSPEAVRAALAVGFTLALFARWPAVEASAVGPVTMAAWAVSEAAVGIAIGVPVAIVLEVFILAAQVLGLQAGYAYASTIDPNTEADSGVLLVFAQLMAGLLFFCPGARPGNSASVSRRACPRFRRALITRVRGSAEAIIRLGASLFSVGVRLALPVVALLVLVDVALALLGRLNAQLQLLSLAFPAKMLTALAMLSAVAALFPRIAMSLAGQAWGAMHKALGI